MIEGLIITVLVLWSCIIVFKKVMPKTANRTFTLLADTCQQKGWHAMAKKLRPKMAAGCGGSCGCSTDDEPSTVQEIKTVKWK